MSELLHARNLRNAPAVRFAYSRVRDTHCQWLRESLDRGR